MDEDTGPSRRQVLGGVAVGATIAATVAAPALAAGQRSGAPTLAQAEARVETYPKPPFEVQHQPFPGLARDMRPRPDHGETSYRGTGRLVGRKALVTGGDSGIGRAAAIAYAREGADVAINYLPQEEADAREVIELIHAAGRKGVALPGDLRDEQFTRGMVDRAARGLGGLDIVVNVAGRQQAVPEFKDYTTQLFDDIYKTNCYAIFWVCHAALPHLRPGAVIINTASEQAYDPSKDILVYASTKAAIANFSKGLAKNLAKQGIRVNAVAPGPFWTPLQVSGGATDQKLQNFGGDAPIGRPGQPAEIAGIYVALADPAFSYTLGNVFAATGGNAAA